MNFGDYNSELTTGEEWFWSIAILLFIWIVVGLSKAYTKGEENSKRKKGVQ